jgi:hypothetical protein
VRTLLNHSKCRLWGGNPTRGLHTFCDLVGVFAALCMYVQDGRISYTVLRHVCTIHSFSRCELQQARQAKLCPLEKQTTDYEHPITRKSVSSAYSKQVVSPPVLWFQSSHSRVLTQRRLVAAYSRFWTTFRLTSKGQSVQLCLNCLTPVKGDMLRRNVGNKPPT